ncbi:MAG: hypothetical protein V2B18_11560 [Pseudomonadota bacterium]
MNKAFVFSLVVCLIGAAAPATPSAKYFKGFQGVELGMKRADVVGVLKARMPVEDILMQRNEVSAAIRDNRYFRHVCCKFNALEVLTEMALTMREVVGKQAVLSELSKECSIDLPAEGSVVQDGISITVGPNVVVLADANQAIGRVNAKRGPTK